MVSARESGVKAEVYLCANIPRGARRDVEGFATGLAGVHSYTFVSVCHIYLSTFRFVTYMYAIIYFRIKVIQQMPIANFRRTYYVSRTPTQSSRIYNPTNTYVRQSL